MPLLHPRPVNAYEKQTPERTANPINLEIPHRAFRVFVLSCFRDKLCILGHSNPIMMLLSKMNNI
jgi:hypothetical protein